MIACVAMLSCAAVTCSAQDYDLVILDGRVMDPETNLDATRNVGVKDGRIQVITSTKITGKQSIDASGHVVTPGFIDLHCHGQDPYTYGSSIIGADYLAQGFQEKTGMDYKDITYVKTGEKMTKELLAKYRKDDPGGMMLMNHIKEREMLAA